MVDKSYNHIDLSYMDLMADGDHDMKKTMLEMLLEELPTEVSKLKSSFSSNNLKDLKAISHKLKSTLAFVGNESLTTTNKEVERIAKEEDDVNRVGDLLGVMEQECEKVIPELKTEYSKL